MRATHRTHSKVQVPKGKVSDPPMGTQREYARTRLVSKTKLKKGKAVKHSVTGIGKPSPTMSALPHVPKTSPHVTTSATKEKQNTNDQPVQVPAVPVLRSPPPTGPHITNVTPCVGSSNVPTIVTPISDNTAVLQIINDTAGVAACTALVNQPTSQAGAPQPLT